MAGGDSVTRLSQYKSRKTPSSQEERRKLLLEEQRRLRSEAFNEGRHIIEAGDSLYKHAHERNKFYKNKLMLSEWFLEIPCDFQENWVMVPCPMGKRTLVLAGNGITVAFAKDGTVLSRFRSFLPGGRIISGETTGVSILDCIWSKINRSYYIIDVIMWNKHYLDNCDAEFRFYWLKTKLSELENISETSENNTYSFYLLPTFSCDRGTLETALNTNSLVPDVAIDGLLFYHLQAHYVAGCTPLVGWLKPFMIPDIFNISVNEELLHYKPKDYVDYRKYIHEYEEKGRNRKLTWKAKQRARKLSKRMEVELVDAAQEEVGEEFLDDDCHVGECSETSMDFVDVQSAATAD